MDLNSPDVKLDAKLHIIRGLSLEFHDHFLPQDLLVCFPRKMNSFSSSLRKILKRKLRELEKIVVEKVRREKLLIYI